MHADRWGALGSVFAALCCLGAAPVLAALSAVGLGFLIHDAILIPMLALFLGVTIRALNRDRSPRARRAGEAGLGSRAPDGGWPVGVRPRGRARPDAPGGRVGLEPGPGARTGGRTGARRGGMRR